jgi:predicted nucleotidyltransferase
MSSMNRADAISRLQQHADALRAMGATSLYMFGSVARDASKSSSDLDVFVEYDPEGRFNAFDLVGIKLFLQEKLDMPVDVTTRDGLHPMLRSDIEQDAIRVF